MNAVEIELFEKHPEHHRLVHAVFMKHMTHTLFQTYFLVRKQNAKRKISAKRLVEAVARHWMTPAFVAYWELGGSKQFPTKERWERWLEEMLDMPKIDLTPSQVSKIYDDIAAAEADVKDVPPSSVSSTPGS